jgi:hypothetical protein
MWIKLYRYKVYRYLPITVIIGAIAFVPALTVVLILLSAVRQLLRV